MIVCNQCKKCGKCGKPYGRNSNYAEKCKDFEKKKTTNFENLSDIKKLAKFFSRIADCSACPLKDKCVANPTRDDCTKLFTKWLESEEN